MATITSSQITDEQLASYAALIYDRTGISVSPKKKTLLSNRVRRRLRETGIADYDAYLKHLKKLRSQDPEWDHFLQEITTHETYLFRDESQWKWFRKEFLPECVKKSRETGKRSLRIWSAACSTGDEATTVAVCIADAIPNFREWKIQIVGTDIGIGALEHARSGVFDERAMRLVDEGLKRRFFVKSREAEIWRPKPEITSMLTFKQHNLIEPLAREAAFDLVIIKNVLIYFDAKSKATVMKHVLDRVAPGGLLLSGAAEGISDLVRHLERVQAWLFRKPQ